MVAPGVKLIPYIRILPSPQFSIVVLKSTAIALFYICSTHPQLKWLRGDKEAEYKNHCKYHFPYNMHQRKSKGGAACRD